MWRRCLVLAHVFMLRAVALLILFCVKLNRFLEKLNRPSGMHAYCSEMQSSWHVWLIKYRKSTSAYQHLLINFCVFLWILWELLMHILIHAYVHIDTLWMAMCMNIAMSCQSYACTSLNRTQWLWAMGLIKKHLWKVTSTFG